MKFDAGFYKRYYRDPATRVATREDALKLGRFICAFTSYLGFGVRRVLDAGCGFAAGSPDSVRCADPLAHPANKISDSSLLLSTPSSNAVARSP